MFLKIQPYILKQMPILDVYSILFQSIIVGDTYVIPSDVFSSGVSEFLLYACVNIVKLDL